MPDYRDLRNFVLHNLHQLRRAPNTIAAISDYRQFRWDDLVFDGEGTYGFGCNLHDGPALGGVWLYGGGVRGVALHPYRDPQIPMAIQPLLLELLQDHLNGFYV